MPAERWRPTLRPPGLEAYVFMPKDVPIANRLEVEAAGAHLTLVDGLISDCGRMVAERKEKEGWFDMSTLKEPFRIEGKKTMGYEVAEQMGWTLPDAILYPTGGGVGLIGMWKAFEEMEELGWIDAGKRPKMICVQAEGCAPIPKALQDGEAVSKMWPDAHTLAAGLRVPKAYGDFIILDIVRKSGGTAIAVSDDAIMDGVKEMASHGRNFPRARRWSGAGGLQQLLESGFLKESDKVVLFNTGSGYKYLDVFAKYWGVEGVRCAGEAAGVAEYWRNYWAVLEKQHLAFSTWHLARCDSQRETVNRGPYRLRHECQNASVAILRLLDC